MRVRTRGRCLVKLYPHKVASALLKDIFPFCIRGDFLVDIKLISSLCGTRIHKLAHKYGCDTAVFAVHNYFHLTSTFIITVDITSCISQANKLQHAQLSHTRMHLIRTRSSSPLCNSNDTVSRQEAVANAVSFWPFTSMKMQQQHDLCIILAEQFDTISKFAKHCGAACAEW